MNEGQTIFTALTDDGDVTALIGTRVYPEGEAPQNPTLPFITYSRIAGVPHHSLDDYGNVENVVVEINCWSDDFAQVEDLANKTRIALANGLTVSNFTDIALYEPVTKLHRVTITVSLWI